MALQQVCRRCFTALSTSKSAAWKPLVASSHTTPPMPPDYDLEGSGHLTEGQRIFESPKPKLTGIEESTAEWKFVEKILPSSRIPEPPQHEKYPTPSGWSPVTAKPDQYPYFIRRTRFHNFPIYMETHDGGNRKMTVIKHVEGDMWAFESELRSYLEKKTQRRMHTQVCEISHKIRVRGFYLDPVCDFMVQKGF